MASEKDTYLLQFQVQVQGDPALRKLNERLDAAAKGTEKAQASFRKAGKATKNYGHIAQNVGFQMQDMVTQIAGGQGALRALGQQLPQMTVGFGAWGAAIGVVAAVIPAMLMMLSDTGDEVKELSDALDDATTDWDAYEEALKRVEKTGAKVDIVIANILKTMSDASTTAAIQALKTEALGLVDSARSMSEIPQPEGGFWDGLIESFREAREIMGPSMVEEVNELGKAFKEVNQFGGNENLAEYNRLIKELNDENIDQTIIGLTELAARMEGTASPELIQRINDLILSMNDFRTSTEETTDAVKTYAEQMEEAARRTEALAEIQVTATRHQGTLAAAQAVAANDRQQMIENQLQYEWDLEQAAIAREKAAAAAAEKEAAAAAKAAEALTFSAQAAEAFEHSFDTAFDGVAMGTQNVADAFRNMAKVIIAQLLKIAAYKTIAGFDWTGGTFGGQTPWTTNAKGNAFSGRNVVPFAKGGVVNQPTVFPMANGGVGLMGEAGAPEAVMPLRRMGNGNLGVESSGMNVTVNNMAQGVSVNPRQGSDGLTIDVVLAQAARAVQSGGNVFADSIEKTYSVNRGRGVY